MTHELDPDDIKWLNTAHDERRLVDLASHIARWEWATEAEQRAEYYVPPDLDDAGQMADRVYLEKSDMGQEPKRNR